MSMPPNPDGSASPGRTPDLPCPKCGDGDVSLDYHDADCPDRDCTATVMVRYGEEARAALIAALGICKVEERRDYRTFSVRAEDGFGRARSAPAPYRHLVIITPAEPDPSAGQP